MSKWTKKSCLAGVAGYLFITVQILLAGELGPDQMLLRIHEKYGELREGVRMECVVTRQESQGEFWRKTPGRKYRVFIRGRDSRIDMLGDGGSAITRVVSDGKAILYNRYLNQFVGGSADEHRDITESVTRSRNLFFQRYVDLGESRPIVTRGGRQTVKAGSRKVDCTTFKLRPPEGSSAKWSAEIWVEEETGLIWRSKMRALRENGLMDEDIQWTSIERGEGLVLEIADWQPPANATRVAKFAGTAPE